MKFVWPMLLSQMEEREKRIADGLASAEEGNKKLQEADVKLQEAINEGKQKASEIIAQAQKQGDSIIEDAKQTAIAEGNRLKEAAQGDIEQEKERAREELKQQVATLALAGAEQVLMREVDANAHSELLSKVSAEL